MPKVVRLTPPRVIEEREAASAMADELARLPAHVLPPELRGKVLRQLRRAADPDEPLWPGGFFMLSKIQAVAIWEAIWNLPNIARRNQVHRAFDLICACVERNTGEVLMSRDEIAQKIGCAPAHVSNVMGTLKDLGVIARTERRRVPGVRGPGEAVYFVNANVAWNGELEIRRREAAKSEPPLLKIMNGGKAKT